MVLGYSLDADLVTEIVLVASAADAADAAVVARLEAWLAHALRADALSWLAAEALLY